MIGAIIGDIVGSRFEWDNQRSKDFDFLTHKCFFTHDSVMSLAVCDALLPCKPDSVLDALIRIAVMVGPSIAGCTQIIRTPITATETELRCVSAVVAT